MAAHVKTALEQIIVGNFHYDHLMPAFNISCWTDDLDFSDYVDFRAIVESYSTMPDNKRYDMVKITAKTLLPKYTAVWKLLGKPDNREEWHKAKYRGNNE